MTQTVHQYIERGSAKICTEDLFSDSLIRIIYSSVREKIPWAYQLLLSSRTSSLLGFLNFDARYAAARLSPHQLFNRLNINPDDIFGDIRNLNTYRRIFERQIRYWDVRPMEQDPFCVVSPADSRALPGSFTPGRVLFIKEKFFNFEELISPDKPKWLSAFKCGDYFICRLTPEKYHYNHTPVSGKMVDIYEISGKYHSCNPGAVVQTITPYSKNRRIVTIIDTDVDNGTGVGLVAMIEIVAMMIGRISQCYSDEKYESPEPVKPGTFIQKGRPKSLFKPGSSTTVLLFQKGRIQFSRDLLKNMHRTDVQSRFTQGFKKPLVETDIHVRQTIARRI